MNPGLCQGCLAWPLTSLCMRQNTQASEIKAHIWQSANIYPHKTVLNHRDNVRKSRSSTVFPVFLKLSFQRSLGRDILWTLSTVCPRFWLGFYVSRHMQLARRTDYMPKEVLLASAFKPSLEKHNISWCGEMWKHVWNPLWVRDL